MAAGIVDSKDILDFERYLDKKEKEIKCMDHVLGPELITFPQYISSSRSIMFTSHLKQFVTLNNPEFPRLFTNYENIFGKLSSALHKTKEELIVYKVVPKFSWAPKHIYTMFFHDVANKKYFCITKKIAEELTEKFGYAFNNERMDKFNPGNKIKKGTTLFKSTSYDQYDNYCYGCNALTTYLIDNRTIEDAVICSQSFANKMISKEVETVKITINDNDLLLNLYGDSLQHKGFPDIGEKIKGKLICSKRRLINSQLLYDMKASNLSESNNLNDREYYSKGTVIDVNIYCNQNLDEIPKVPSNTQLLKYLNNQKRYWTEIYKVCGEIIESGEEYDDDIGFLYGRARDYLDPNYRWKDNDSIFNNMIMELTVMRDVPLNIGYKISGRYGNKGVISTIVPDEEMPTLEDGRHVEVVFNALGVINRLNSAQLFEVSINFISNRILEKMKTARNQGEMETLFWTYMNFFNERGECTQLKNYYKKLNNKQKNEFWQEIFDNGIFINIPPISQREPLFDTLKKIYDTFPWIKPYDVYINKWGRRIKLMNPLYAGEEYIFKLKQTAKKNFSVRSTGYLSQRGLPDKSSKAKHNQQLYSTTPITIGRDENNNLGIGIHSYTLAKFHLIYRSSPIARRDFVAKLYTHNPLKPLKFKIKKKYKNRNVEIFNAYLKCMGNKMDYGKNALRIMAFDKKLREIKYRDRLYITSYGDMRNTLLKEVWDKKFNKKLHVGTREQIKESYEYLVDKEKAKINGKLFVELRGK